MCKYFKSPLAFFGGMAFLISCSSANNKPLSVRFSRDSSSIIFSSIDPAGLLQLKNTPHLDSSYAEVLSVAELPDENDSTGLELPFPGKVQVNDTALIFIPIRSFKPGRSYLVTSYLNVRFGNAAMMLKGQMGHGVKPEQLVLKR